MSRRAGMTIIQALSLYRSPPCKGHSEQFEEAPNTADLREALLAVSESAVLGPAFMRGYLGEDAA